MRLTLGVLGPCGPLEKYFGLKKKKEREQSLFLVPSFFPLKIFLFKFGENSNVLGALWCKWKSQWL